MPGRGKSKRKRNKSSPNHPHSIFLKRHRTNKTLANYESDSEASGEAFYTPATSEISDSESDSETPSETKMCSKTDLEEVVAKLKVDLIQDLKAEFEIIVAAKTQALQNEVSKLQEEVQHLRNCVKTANHENDELEQYGRRMMLDVSGIPGDTGDIYENVESKILNYAKTAKIDLSPEDIDKAHRLGRWKSDVMVNRRVIIKFTSSKARQKIYNARKTLPDGIFVQESLTRKREQLSYHARQLKRECLLVKTWVAGARIYGTMKINGDETKIQINSMDDIQVIKDGKKPQYTVPVYP